jgi:transcription-repair coupling factor (superfamily II helicase)
VLYKRLASCNDSDNLRAMQEELIDRFGSLPDAARVLFDIHRLRLATRALGIVKVDADNDAVTLNFIAKPPIDPARIIQLIQTRRDIKLAGENRLRWQTASTPDTRTSTVLAFFDLLR